MGVYQCQRCSECGSDLAESPASHRDPQPHRMLAERLKVETDAGQRDAGTLTRCIWCQDTLSEVEAAKEPWEHWPNPEQVIFIDGRRYHFPELSEQAKGYMARLHLTPERSAYSLHIDDAAKPLSPALRDFQDLPWGSKLVAVPLISPGCRPTND